jgi:ABC-type multidrug transport system ATPase subunit
VLSDVESLCDAVVVIDHGKVVYSGATEHAVGAAPSSWRVRVVAASEQPPSPTARREGDTWVVAVDGSDGVAAAAALQAAGARVLSLEPLRESLEERLTQLLRQGGGAP